MNWRSGYHRISDDSVSSYGGHESEETANAEARTNSLDDDISISWVRDPNGNVIREFQDGKEFSGWE